MGGYLQRNVSFFFFLHQKQELTIEAIFMDFANRMGFLTAFIVVRVFFPLLKVADHFSNMYFKEAL